MTDLITFGRAHSKDLSMLLARAFLNGPVGDWLVPDISHRFQVYVPYFGIFADHVLEHGLAYGPADLSGAALWMDATDGMPSIDDFDARLEKACGPYTWAFMALDELFTQVHPHAPHWYLMFIGVSPERQRQGLGTFLLDHHHRVLDRTGQSAFLEASNFDNHRLYRRHGYENLIMPPNLGGDGPRIWPMWRAPQQPL